MISKSVNFRTGLIIGAVLLVGIAVFLNNTVGNLGVGRFDLTEDGIYTVSGGAKNIMASLDVPVSVKYYVTPENEMPAGLNTLQQDVSDKLSELSIASRGMLEYELVNPTESEELQEKLIGKGVRPFPVQSIERDAMAVKNVYSAIAIGYRDEAEEIMPQILPDNMGSLEYELLSRITKMTRDDEPVVALYSTKEAIDPQLASFYLQQGQPLPPPVDAFQPIPQFLRGEGYDIRATDITEGNPIPDDAHTLVLLGVRELNDRQRYEIFRVLRRGGNVFVATQATKYDYGQDPRGGYRISVQPMSLGINDLLTEFGVRIDSRMLMDQQMATLAIPRTQNIGGLRFQVSEPVQAPMQIRVMGESIDRDLPFTAGVPELLYLWGNQIVVDDAGVADKNLTATTIFAGSNVTWTIDRQSGALNPEDLDPENHTTVANPPLAVLIEGAFPDPWEGQPTPEWPAAAPGQEPELPDDPEEDVAGAELPPEPGRLLVVGCSKMFEENLIDQAGHALFLLNSVDAMTLGEDLISIRSKQFGQRTFGEVSDGKKVAFRFLNIALVPILVAGVGLGNRLRRKRESEEYAAKIAGGSVR